MAWEENMPRTMYIVRGRRDGATRYWIYPLCTVEHPTSGVYVEKLPTHYLAGGTSDVMNFVNVVFIDEPYFSSSATAGAMNLIRVASDGVRGNS